jgi:hypothetical protein
MYWQFSVTSCFSVGFDSPANFAAEAANSLVNHAMFLRVLGSTVVEISLKSCRPERFLKIKSFWAGYVTRRTLGQVDMNPESSGRRRSLIKDAKPGSGLVRPFATQGRAWLRWISLRIFPDRQFDSKMFDFPANSSIDIDFRSVNTSGVSLFSS